MQEIILEAGMSQKIKTTPLDKNQQPSQIEQGTQGYASSDTAIAEVVEDADNEQLAVINALTPGEAIITAQADADLLDTAQDFISGTIKVTVVPRRAKTIKVETDGDPFETPVAEQPAPVEEPQTETPQ